MQRSALSPRSSRLAPGMPPMPGSPSPSARDYYRNSAPPTPPTPDFPRSASDMAVDQADEALSAAAQALENVSKRNKGTDGIAASMILSAASKVVNALDPIASMHPATQIMFGIFKAVINIEEKREQNQVEIAAVMFTMTATVHQVQAAQPIFANQDDPKLTQPLEDIVKRISKVIEEFGNFTNLYYKGTKKSKVSNFLRAGDNKGKLEEFKGEFIMVKEELKTYLEICHIQLSSKINDKVDAATSKLDKILERLGGGDNPEEAQFWNYVNANGGAENVINNDKLIQDAADLLGEQVTGPMMAELRTDMSSLLDQNRIQFEATVTSSVGTAVIDSLRKIEADRLEAEKEQKFICIQCEKEYRNSVNGPNSCSFHKAVYDSWSKSYPCCSSSNPCQSNSHRSQHHCKYPYGAFFQRAWDITRYTDTIDKWDSIEDTNLEDDSVESAMVGQLLRWKTRGSRIQEPTIILQVGRVRWDSPYFFDTFTPAQLAMISKSLARSRQTLIFRTSPNAWDFSMAEWLFAADKITGIRLTVKSATSEYPFVHIVPIKISDCSKMGDVIVQSEGGFRSFIPSTPYVLPENVRVGPVLSDKPLRELRKDFKTRTTPAFPILIKSSSDPPLLPNQQWANHEFDSFEGTISLFNKNPPGDLNAITIDSIDAKWRMVGEEKYKNVLKVEIPDVTFPLTIEPRQTISIAFSARVPRTEEDQKLEVRWFKKAFISRFRPLRLKLIVSDIEGEEASLVIEQIHVPWSLDQKRDSDLAFIFFDNPQIMTRRSIQITANDPAPKVISVDGTDLSATDLQTIVFKAIKTKETEIEIEHAGRNNSDWTSRTYALVDTLCRRVYAFKFVLKDSRFGCIHYLLCPEYGDTYGETRPVKYAAEKVTLPGFEPYEMEEVVEDDEVDDFVPQKTNAISTPALNGAGHAVNGNAIGGSVVMGVPPELSNQLSSLDNSVNRLAAAVERLIEVLEKKA